MYACMCDTFHNKKVLITKEKYEKDVLSKNPGDVNMSNHKSLACFIILVSVLQRNRTIRRHIHMEGRGVLIGFIVMNWLTQ